MSHHTDECENEMRNQRDLARSPVICICTDAQLLARFKLLAGKIDGPENDGRITAHGSYSLDYWMDTLEEISNELKSRGVELPARAP